MKLEMFTPGHTSRGVFIVKVVSVTALLLTVVFFTDLTDAPPKIRVPYAVQLSSTRRVSVYKGDDPPIHLPSMPPVLSAPTMELPMAKLENFLPNAYLYANRGAPYNSSVITFLHNPKSGGTSMRDCMLTLSEAAGKPAPTIVTVATISDVRTKHLNHVIEVNDYYTGEASIGMCDFVDGRPCSYFTVMREPFERSVSHYYFCKGGGKGWPPCDNSLEEFTLSLCSLFFRQMTMKIFCEHLVEGDESSPWKCADHLTSIDHLHNIPEKRAATLKYILENIDKIFAVIGITEEYETSLKLLEHTFREPFYGLCKTKHSNAGNYIDGDDIRDKKGDREKIHAEAKERLMKNEEVQKCLHEDIQIYNKVLEIFEMEKQILQRS